MSLLIPFSTRTGFFDPFSDNSVASLIAGAIKLNINENKVKIGS